MASAANPTPTYDCLVLSGGGSKGAYGAGVAKAITAYRILKELDNPICHVGASAGALNAYILASRDADALIKFWLDVTNKKILGVRNGKSKLHAGWKYVSEYFSSKPRALYGNNGLAALVGGNATLKALHGPLVIAATDYTRGQLRALYASPLIDEFMCKDQKRPVDKRRLAQFRRIQDDAMLIKSLLASAAIPFFFPPVEITTTYGGKEETGLFIDGGVGNNTPTREAAYFLRFLDAEKAGRAGVTFCVKQEQPRIILEEAGRLEFSDILLRTLDVYHDVHTRPIIGAWNRINDEVAEQRKAIGRVRNWLRKQALSPALRKQIVNQIKKELGKPGGQAPRLDMPLVVIDPSIPLGDTLDFDPRRARKEIRHGYIDTLRAVRHGVDRRYPALTPGEFDMLVAQPIFPKGADPS
jgi:predicted acylesterase/phospholipase RssA